MPQLFLNNARADLAGPVLSGDTLIVIENPVGIPATLAPGEWFYATMYLAATRYGSNHEVVKVTSIFDTGPTYEMTVTRAQDGTAAVAHDQTEEFQALINAAALEDIRGGETQSISTATSARSFTYYVLTASLVLTLPATPAAGDWVRISNRSATTTGSVARNGSNIMGLAEDLTLDVADAGFTLTYVDATQGWVIS